MKRDGEEFHDEALVAAIVLALFFVMVGVVGVAYLATVLAGDLGLAVFLSALGPLGVLMFVKAARSK